MNNQSISARRVILIAALLLILTATACAPVRQGTAWPDISLDSQKNIVVAYENRIDLVDPATHLRVSLRNEAGEVRREEGNILEWELEGNWPQDGSNVRSRFYTAPVFLNEDTFLITDYAGYLLRVDYATARIERSVTKIDGNVVADAVADEATNSLYVPLSERDVVALDMENFDTRWVFETERGVWSQPLVIEGTVYFVGMDHYFYAVDAESGEQVWSLDLEGAAAASPLYDAENERFYVGTFASKVFEVSLEGEILSQYETEDWVWNTPVLQDGILYTADLSGYVYALNTGDGLSELWKTKATSAGIRPTPLVSGGYAVVASRKGQVVWLNQVDGTIAFQEDVDAEVLSDILLIEPGESTTVTEPLVIIGTAKNSRLLLAFSLADGSLRWTYSR
ncbi:MAG: PQQ-binding-like beta-propeller repeat protein [Chitinophagaceae bacterium]|nr:PQQ-binding-like beta-propeller repeat protein [Anaerolineae bacterium]